MRFAVTSSGKLKSSQDIQPSSSWRAETTHIRTSRNFGTRISQRQPNKRSRLKGIENIFPTMILPVKHRANGIYSFLSDQISSEILIAPPSWILMISYTKMFLGIHYMAYQVENSSIWVILKNSTYKINVALAHTQLTLYSIKMFIKES